MEYPNFKIHDLAVEDRPREKCMRQGLGGLSNTELLAILIGTGTRNLSALDLARIVLQKADNDLHRLGKMSLAELEKIHGIGEAKAIRIQASFELARRRKASLPDVRPKVR